MDLTALIQQIPKAELHLHIEGTLEPELMMKLAQRNNIEIPYASVEEIRSAYEFSDLQSFLDIYYAGALATAALKMSEKRSDLYLGAMNKVEVDGSDVRFVKRSSPHQGEPIHHLPITANGRRYDFHFFQPSMFWTREIWERTGGLDERYDYMMDMEWCNRALACGVEVVTSDDMLTRFALHPGSKTQDFRYRQLQEEILMYWRLSQVAGFRRFPCMLASLKPTQKWLSFRAKKAEAEGARFKAALFRNGSRVLKAISINGAGRRGSTYPLAGR